MEEAILEKLPVWERLAKEIFWKQVGELKGMTILDFGSGKGVTANHYAAGNDVTAVEPSSEILAERVDTNSYCQIIGSTDELKKLVSESFDFIICHNVLEYADDREIIIRELYRLLKRGGKMSVVKHNRNGRVMQMAVLLNNFDEANALLDGGNSTARLYGTINYFEDDDIIKWCDGFKLVRTFGARTFWDLQQNQEIQKDNVWQKKMIEIEMRVSADPAFQNIAFFHHLIFEK